MEWEREKRGGGGKEEKEEGEGKRCEEGRGEGRRRRGGRMLRILTILFWPSPYHGITGTGEEESDRHHSKIFLHILQRKREIK